MDSFDPGVKDPSSSQEESAQEKTSVDGGILVPRGASIELFDLPVLQGSKLPTYAKIKESFERNLRPADTRFHLEEGVANQMSVEEEELQRFQQKVDQQVAEKVAEIKEAAQKEGYEAGLKNGEEKAFAEKGSQLEATKKECEEYLQAMQNARMNLAQKYQEELVNIAFKVAEILIHYEMQERPAMLSKTIEDMLEKIAKEDDVVVRVSKAIADVVPEMKKDLEEGSRRSGRIQFEVDENLEAGDVIVECLSGEVASFIDERISLLREAVISGLEENG